MLNFHDLDQRLQPLPSRLLLGSATAPPGPGPLATMRQMARYPRDPLGVMQGIAREYPGMALVWLGHQPAYLVTDPALIEEVLLKRRTSFRKDEFTDRLAELLGEGLLTNEGESWRRQRKRIAPHLTRRQVSAYGDTMAALTEEHASDYGHGRVVDAHRQMMDLTLRIVLRTLFDADLGREAQVIEEAMEEVQDYFRRHAQTLWRYVPNSSLIPHRRRFEEAAEALDGVIFELIQQRRSQEVLGDDLLSRLLAAVDDDGAMTDAQLRDEVITMYMAGHETTALALAYGLHLLAYHGEARDRLVAEVDEAIGGDRLPTMADMENLPFTRAVVQEAMRLYPPAWIMGREALEEVQIGAWTVPRGAMVLMCQWVMHRDERWFEAPESFRPERWLDGLERELPRFAYFPFGGGERVCIGNHFAMMEAVLVLAALHQQLLFDPMPGTKLQLRPSVTLRPGGEILLRARRRDVERRRGQAA